MARSLSIFFCQVKLSGRDSEPSPSQELASSLQSYITTPVTHGVQDRQHDGDSAVQVAVLHLFLSGVRVKDGHEGGVVRLGGGVYTAPDLQQQ